MREYFRYFRFPFLALAILVVICGIGVFVKKPDKTAYVRTNSKCPEERVFDKAEVLSDEEEESLRELIAEKEKAIGTDIVIVTLNESLKEYAREYDSEARYDEFVMIYADNFYDEHEYGFNKPIGDGVLLLDNIYREDDGKVYTWFSTCGKAEDRYSPAMIDRILDEFYEYVDSNPYRAYREFVEHVARDMSPNRTKVEIPWYVPIVVAVVATVVFILLNLSNRKGRKTTTQRSYINGGQPHMRHKEDLFIRKSVTKRKIETSSGGGSGSSGGGGHHTSSSGASHGGGGHSR